MIVFVVISEIKYYTNSRLRAFNETIVDSSWCTTYDEYLLEYTRRAMLPLRENMTSSTKPDVHNISQHREKRTKPRP